jgi:hypothetical protein
MTIAEAARQALQSLGKASTILEIHAEITRRGLYDFRAKDPAGVLAAAIRRRMVGSRMLRGPATFKSTGDRKFGLVQ